MGVLPSIIPKPNRALRKLAVFVMTIGFSLALAITVAYFAQHTALSTETGPISAAVRWNGRFTEQG
jgi:hypothetical protein